MKNSNNKITFRKNLGSRIAKKVHTVEVWCVWGGYFQISLWWIIIIVIIINVTTILGADYIP